MEELPDSDSQDPGGEPERQPDGLEKLFAILYQDLYRSAARAMSRQGPGHTLQPTALVSEAYMKLMGGTNIGYSDRD
ncbi:MAG: ECF-type sigma factor, partial [Planctomycetota bacterium]